MGLDISYYKDLMEASGNEGFDETGGIKDDDGWIQINVNPDFPGREDGLKDNHAYKAKEEDGFRAGSYGGYNAWRNDLAKLAGYNAKSVDRHGTGRLERRYDEGAWAEESGPFWELITFSDCEGVIGPETSKKLAKDFADHQDDVDIDEGERFKSLYNKWRKAFESASNNGAVRFG